MIITTTTTVGTDLTGGITVGDTTTGITVMDGVILTITIIGIIRIILIMGDMDIIAIMDIMGIITIIREIHITAQDWVRDQAQDPLLQGVRAI